MKLVKVIMTIEFTVLPNDEAITIGPEELAEVAKAVSDSVKINLMHGVTLIRSSLDIGDFDPTDGHNGHSGRK